MRQTRLLVLMSAMLLLAVLRIAVPPRASEPVTAEAIATRESPRTLVQEGAESSTARALSSVASDPDIPGDAFPVRVQEAQIPSVPAPPATKVTTAPTPPPVVTPPPVPQPPDVSLSLRVIGTYDDGGPPAVFLATPAGTLMARPGALLMDQFRVTGITATQVAVVEVSTQRVFELAVPGRSHP
jgi:hypothetical protein